MKGFKISPEQQKAMLRNIRVMFWLFFAHTCLVFYSAFFMSKEAWVFISGGLFYILFGVYFLYMMTKNIIARKKYKKEINQKFYGK